MTDYLPVHASIDQTTSWLEREMGGVWDLPRLIEIGLTPWFWLDCNPNYPAIFGDRNEGYLAPMVFAGDLSRLATAGLKKALVTITKTHDGQLIRFEQGILFPLDNLMFKRDDIQNLIVSAAAQKGSV